MDKHSNNGNHGAGETLHDAQEDVENLSEELRDLAEKARDDVVKRMQSTANRVREVTKNTQGEIKDGAEKVAKRFEESAEHLANFKLKDAEEKVEEVVGKVTDTAEENTWKTVLVVLIIGIVIGWLLSNMQD